MKENRVQDCCRPVRTGSRERAGGRARRRRKTKGGADLPLTTSLTKAASAKMSRLYSGRRLCSMVAAAKCVEAELETGSAGERHTAVGWGRVAGGRVRTGAARAGGDARRTGMVAVAVAAARVSGVERRRRGSREWWSGRGRGWDGCGGEVSGLCGAVADEDDGKPTGAGSAVGEIISTAMCGRIVCSPAQRSTVASARSRLASYL